MFSLILILLITTLPSYAQSTPAPCTKYNFVPTKNKPNNVFKKCVDLPLLNSALHYTYQPPTQTLELAYRHRGTTSMWVAWALNPTAKGMIGAQCLVAHRSPKNGSVIAYTSAISSYKTRLDEGVLSFNVTGLKAENIKDEIIIFATINNVPNVKSVVNMVWQEGLLSKDGFVEEHSMSGPSLRSMASLNLDSGAIHCDSSLKIAHGIINVISWGFLMPVGALIAMHTKNFFPSADPAWFYLHAGCQLTAYILGVTGWATGLKLASGSADHHQLHRFFGTLLFCMATLQVSALFLRPDKDHKYRANWNKAHQSVGQITIFTSILNIFQGLRILKPGFTWHIAYIILVFVLLMIELLLGIIVSNRKKTEVAESSN